MPRLLVATLVASSILYGGADVLAMGGGGGRHHSGGNSSPAPAGPSTHTSTFNLSNTPDMTLVLREDGDTPGTNYYVSNGPITTTPEPGTIALVTSGAVGLLTWLRRKRYRAATPDRASML
jgi:PEP-CTERM motif